MVGGAAGARRFLSNCSVRKTKSFSTASTITRSSSRDGRPIASGLRPASRASGREARPRSTMPSPSRAAGAVRTAIARRRSSSCPMATIRAAARPCARSRRCSDRRRSWRTPSASTLLNVGSTWGGQPIAAELSAAAAAVTDSAAISDARTDARRPRRRRRLSPALRSARPKHRAWPTRRSPSNVAALRDITDDSGGRTEIVRFARDVEPATDEHRRRTEQRYYLGYASLGRKDGQWHTIRVELRDNRYLVRARKGYVAVQ